MPWLCLWCGQTVTTSRWMEKSVKQSQLRSLMKQISSISIKLQSLGWPRQPRGLRPASVEFQLYKNGKAQGKPVTVQRNRLESSLYESSKIRRWRRSSIPTLLKLKVPTHYTVDTKASFTDGKATITNKRTPETHIGNSQESLGWYKTWNGLRPSPSKVHLLANKNRDFKHDPDWWRRWMDSYLHRPASL